MSPPLCERRGVRRARRCAGTPLPARPPGTPFTPVSVTAVPRRGAQKESRVNVRVCSTSEKLPRWEKENQV